MFGGKDTEQASNFREDAVGKGEEERGDQVIGECK
jgi:hypothetical protein